MPNRKPSEELQELLTRYTEPPNDADYIDVTGILTRVLRKVLFLEASVERHIQELQECKNEKESKEEDKP